MLRGNLNKLTLLKSSQFHKISNDRKNSFSHRKRKKFIRNSISTRIESIKREKCTRESVEDGGKVERGHFSLPMVSSLKTIFIDSRSILQSPNNNFISHNSNKLLIKRQRADDGKMVKNGKMSLFPNYAKPILDLWGGGERKEREGERSRKEGKERRETRLKRERGAETSFAANTKNRFPLGWSHGTATSRGQWRASFIVARPITGHV